MFMLNVVIHRAGRLLGRGPKEGQSYKSFLQETILGVSR